MNIFLWVIFFGLMAPSGMALASWNAVPGDTTYGWKTGMESVLVAVLPSQQLKTATHTKLTQRRLGEVTKVLSGTHAREGLDNLNSQIVLTKDSINKISNVQDRQKAVNEYIKTLQEVSSQLEKEKQTRALAYLPPQQESTSNFSLKNLRGTSQTTTNQVAPQPTTQIIRKTPTEPTNTQLPDQQPIQSTQPKNTAPTYIPNPPQNPNQKPSTQPSPESHQGDTETEDTTITEEIAEEIDHTQEEIQQIIEELEETLENSDEEILVPSAEPSHIPSPAQNNSAAPLQQQNQGRNARDEQRNEQSSEQNNQNNTQPSQQNNGRQEETRGSNESEESSTETPPQTEN